MSYSDADRSAIGPREQPAGRQADSTGVRIRCGVSVSPLAGNCRRGRKAGISRGL